ncbi:MAG: hypothetical protein EAZ66_07240, partial [Alphaproteobacteria bacterium]
MVRSVGAEWGPFREDHLAFSSLTTNLFEHPSISNERQRTPQLGSTAEKNLVSLRQFLAIAAERLLAEVFERFRVSVAGSLDCVRATQSASCRF